MNVNDKLEYIPIFTTPIQQYNFKNDIEHTLLYSQIKKIQEQDKGRKVSNSGGWQSNDRWIKNEEQSELKKLMLIINACVQNFWVHINANVDEYNISIDNYWLNINTPNSYNKPHTHGGFVSGVYYVNAPENSGEICFQHPAGELQSHLWPNYLFKDIANNEIACNTWKFTPNMGVLYLFPSWLSHSVEQNLSKENRCSLSFNTMVLKNDNR